MPIPIPGRVADIVRQSVVQIKSGDTHSGSGVVLAKEQIITNAHVVQGGEIRIESWEGTAFTAKILKKNPRRDLALLSVPGLKSAPLPLADSDKLRPGTPVLAIGHPLGFVGAVSSGVIHAAPSRWLCADVRLAPGNSGGPLADFSGQVVGINTLVSTGGLAYAIPSRAVQRFVSNAPEQKLGVVVRSVEFQPQRFGLLVLAIIPGSAAENASLMPGDVLISITEQEVHFHRGNFNALRRVTVNMKTTERTAA